MAVETKESKELIVIHFEEENSSGHLYVKALGNGQDGEAVLLQDIDTGELVVRKFPRRYDCLKTQKPKQGWLSAEEVNFHQLLTNTGFTPRFISFQGSEQLPESLTMQFANGGAAWEYYHKVLAGEARPVREAFQWLLLAEVLRAFAYLHSGYQYLAPSSDRWVDRIPRGKFIPPTPDHQPWPGIIHHDLHLSNIFLSFPDDNSNRMNTPKILIADFSRMKHLAAFNHFESLDAEFCDIDYFLESFSQMRLGRQNLAIRKVIQNLRRRLDKGAQLIDILRAGLYDECMANFRKLNVTLPRPKIVTGREKVKVFDLEAGTGYMSDFWKLKGVLNGDMTRFRTLLVQQQDVSKCGDVDIHAAIELSDAQLQQLFDRRRQSDSVMDGEDAVLIGPEESPVSSLMWI